MTLFVVTRAMRGGEIHTARLVRKTHTQSVARGCGRPPVVLASRTGAGRS